MARKAPLPTNHRASMIDKARPNQTALTEVEMLPKTPKEARKGGNELKAAASTLIPKSRTSQEQVDDMAIEEGDTILQVSIDDEWINATFWRLYSDSDTKL